MILKYNKTMKYNKKLPLFNFEIGCKPQPEVCHKN